MYFHHYVPGSSWYSFDRPRKHKRLCLPWSHQVVSNSRPMDWESSTLTSGTLIHKTLCLLPLMNSFNVSVNNPITIVWCSLEAIPWQQKLLRFKEILLKLQGQSQINCLFAVHMQSSGWCLDILIFQIPNQERTIVCTGVSFPLKSATLLFYSFFTKPSWPILNLLAVQASYFKPFPPIYWFSPYISDFSVNPNNIKIFRT